MTLIIIILLNAAKYTIQLSIRTNPDLKIVVRHTTFSVLIIYIIVLLMKLFQLDMNRLFLDLFFPPSAI